MEYGLVRQGEGFCYIHTQVEAVAGGPGETPPESMWALNPFKNWFVLPPPFSLGVTAVIVLLTCLITTKGYIWFSGYKYTHGPRGFDLLPDATCGSSGFLAKKEMAGFWEAGAVGEVKGMTLGKVKARLV